VFDGVGERQEYYLPLLTVPLFLVTLLSFTYLSQSHVVNEAWQILCMLVSFLGLGVRIMVNLSPVVIVCF
jgi:uncharacterized membrane protein